MLKEFAILLGILGCMFFFVPNLTHPPIFRIEVGMLPFFAFIFLLLYSAFHCKWLLDNRGERQAVLFLTILVVTTIDGFLVIWLLVPPMVGLI